MESQPQNPKFRNYPENFHPCTHTWGLYKKCHNMPLYHIKTIQQGLLLLGYMYGREEQNRRQTLAAQSDRVPGVLSVLIWVQTDCKDSQQTTNSPLARKEISTNFSI